MSLSRPRKQSFGSPMCTYAGCDSPNGPCIGECESFNRESIAASDKREISCNEKLQRPDAKGLTTTGDENASPVVNAAGSGTPISDAAMFVYNDYGEQAVPMNVARQLERALAELRIVNSEAFDRIKALQSATERRVRYAPASEVSAANRQEAWDSGIAQLGDARLVWANEGDLCWAGNLITKEKAK